jgi:hypothetical protein
VPAHKIDFYLDSSSSLRALTRAARRVADLQQIFLNTVPQPLTQACYVKQLRAGTLFLLAENAAVASKLKQLAPRLLASYVKQGTEVTAIKVEVQVAETAPPTASKPRAKRLSIDSIEDLERLADGLEDTPLKHALARLAARQRAER